jgi:hypothetical protein
MLAARCSVLGRAAVAPRAVPSLLPLRLAAPPRAVPVSTPSLAARSSREFCSDPGSAAQRIQAKLAAHFSVS